MTIEEITRELQAMVDNASMITKPGFSPNAEVWPDNQVPFIELHLAYIRAHKNVNPQDYLSNLRLMVKRR